MQIKTFEADNMAAALKAAKEAFGSEAVILGVKTRKSGKGLMGRWRRPIVELTAAIDTPYPPYEKIPAPEADDTTRFMTFSNQKFQRAEKGRATDYEKRIPIQTYTKPLTPSLTKAMLPAGYVKKLFWFQQQMLVEGVDEDIAMDLIAEVHATAVQSTNLAGDMLHHILESILTAKLKSKPCLPKQPQRQRIMMFIGPTGVGKTTTIAKIATIYTRHKKDALGLITLDNQRVGGISQLAIYARILDLPVKAAATPKALRKAMQSLASQKMILIDTAGVNPNDGRQLKFLEAFIQELNTPQVQLVLSTTTKERDLNVILAGFEGFPIQHLLFSKLDESTTMGNILNQMIRTKIPLSYYTDGRKIPDDIHVMTARRLIHMLFNETSRQRTKALSPETLAERMEAFEHKLEKLNPNSQPYRDFSIRWNQKDTDSRQSRPIRFTRFSGHEKSADLERIQSYGA